MDLAQDMASIGWRSQQSAREADGTREGSFWLSATPTAAPREGTFTLAFVMSGSYNIARAPGSALHGLSDRGEWRGHD